MILARFSLLFCIAAVAHGTPHGSPHHHSMASHDQPPMMDESPTADPRSDPIDIVVENVPSDMEIENLGGLVNEDPDFGAEILAAAGSGAASPDISEEELVEMVEKDEELQELQNLLMNVGVGGVSDLLGGGSGLLSGGSGLLGGGSDLLGKFKAFEAGKASALPIFMGLGAAGGGPKGMKLTGKALVKAGLMLKVKSKLASLARAKAVAGAKLGMMAKLKKLLMTPFLPVIGLKKKVHFGLKSLIAGKTAALLGKGAAHFGGKTALFGTKAAAGAGLASLPLVGLNAGAKAVGGMMAGGAMAGGHKLPSLLKQGAKAAAAGGVKLSSLLKQLVAVPASQVGVGGLTIDDESLLGQLINAPLNTETIGQLINAPDVQVSAPKIDLTHEDLMNLDLNIGPGRVSIMREPQAQHLEDEHPTLLELMEALDFTLEDLLELNKALVELNIDTDNLDFDLNIGERSGQAQGPVGLF